MKDKNSPSDANDDAQYPPVSVRISWVRLLKRVFDVDIEHCPHCGGDMKIIAAILEKAAITKILDHLGLPVRAPQERLHKSTIFSSQPNLVLAPFNPHHHGADLYSGRLLPEVSKRSKTIDLFR